MNDSENVPLITTVIRAYNRADTIDRAIQSALAQTLPGQPIIVVDDASTDETSAKVEAYGERVRLIRHDKNRGPGAAGNTGLAGVETPLVAFLDSDDVWHPLFLERMSEALQADPTKVFAYCNYRVVYDQAGLDIQRDTPSVPNGPADVVKSIRAPTSATAGLTAALRRLRGFREDVWYSLDYDLQVRCVLLYPQGFVKINDRLMEHHFVDNNLTDNYDSIISVNMFLLREYLKHPAFCSLRPHAAWLKSHIILTIAGRKYIRDKLGSASTRSVSLIVLHGEDSKALEVSLASAAAQPLPPIDATVLAAPSAQIDNVLALNWPFRIQRISLQSGTPWRALTHALAVSHGDLLAFLNAGDAWTRDALNRHRRAFRTSITEVQFSYGGSKYQAGPPVPLSPHAGARIYQMIHHRVPGSLSKMVVERRKLAQLANLPLSNDCPLWLAVASRLSLEQPGEIVRLLDPIIEQGESRSSNASAIRDVIKALSETETGMPLTALAARLDADHAAGHTPCYARLDGPKESAPIW